MNTLAFFQKYRNFCHTLGNKVGEPLDEHCLTVLHKLGQEVCIRLPQHPLALVPPMDSPQVTLQVEALLTHLEGEMPRQSLQEALGLADREHFRQTYLLPALDAGLIEMTLPDKPNSRSQRYRLTSLGQRWRATHHN